MPSRSLASPKDVQSQTTVAAGLRKSARQIVLLGVFGGVATFAGIYLFAPGHVSGLSRYLELSLLGAFAGVIVGAGSVVLTNVRKRPAAEPRRDETAAPKSEPTLKQVPSHSAEKARPTAGVSNISDELRASPREKAPQSGSTDSLAFVEMESLASRLRAGRPSGGGHRTLITGAAEDVIPFAEARDLAKALSETGAQTILIDWSPSGEGFALTMGLDSRTGWNALLRGEARFDGIIQRLPGTRAHAIASGNALPGGARLDADVVNVALDALDEVYDHIVVTARHDEARVLFELIEGRFDAGIAVVGDEEKIATRVDAGAFLGFEVAEIDIIRYQRLEAVASPVAQRIARASRGREPVALRG